MSVAKREYESYANALKKWRNQADAYTRSVGETPRVYQKDRLEDGPWSGRQLTHHADDKWYVDGPKVSGKPTEFMSLLDAKDRLYQARNLSDSDVTEREVARQQFEAGRDENGNEQKIPVWSADAKAVPGDNGIQQFTPYQRDPEKVYRERDGVLYEATPSFPERPDDTPPKGPGLTLAQEQSLSEPDEDVAMVQAELADGKTVAQKYAGFGAKDGLIARAIRGFK